MKLEKSNLKHIQKALKFLATIMPFKIIFKFSVKFFIFYFLKTVILVFAGLSTNNIDLWDIKSKTVIATLKNHTASLLCLKNLQDGRLASGSWDYSILFWNIQTRQVIYSIYAAHGNAINALELFLNGYLASGSSDGSIKIWNTQNYTQYSVISSAHSSGVHSLKVLKSGNLASGGADSLVKIWDSSNYALKMTLFGHIQTIYALEELQDGKLVSGSLDSTIKVWDLTSGAKLNDFQPNYQFIKSLALLPNNLLAVGTNVGYFMLWSIVSPAIQIPITMITTASLQFSNTVLNDICVIDNNTLALGYNNGAIYIVDMTLFIATASIGSTNGVMCLELAGKF